MIVLMRVARDWQHAGHERPLSVGVEYDLPDGVALSLIAGGDADAVVSLETAAFTGAPENKARGRRR